jgi:hypothetical protein
MPNKPGPEPRRQLERGLREQKVESAPWLAVLSLSCWERAAPNFSGARSRWSDQEDFLLKFFSFRQAQPGAAGVFALGALSRPEISQKNMPILLAREGTDGVGGSVHDRLASKFEPFAGDAGAPQLEFFRHVLRISSRTSRQMTGRPGCPRRAFRVQGRRKPTPCQATTVSGLTMASAEPQSLQVPDTKTHKRRSTGG